MMGQGDGTSSWFVSACVSLPYTSNILHKSYMVVYLPEHLLRCNNQAHDLPNGHLKVHLWKLE